MYTYSALKRDMWLGIATLAFSGFLACATLWAVEVGDSEIAIDGRTFPWMFTVFLAVLGLCLAAESGRRLKDVPQAARRFVPLMTRHEYAGIGKFLALLVVYMLGVTYMDYLLASVLFALLMLPFYGARSAAAMAATAILAPPLLWFAFHICMEVQFPADFVQNLLS